MADDENNLGAALATTDSNHATEEDLVGRKVRIKDTAKDMGSDNAHMWAGMYGEVKKPGPFGTMWLITVGKKAKQFDRSDFDLVQEVPTTSEPAPMLSAAPTSFHTSLVEVAPAQAINSLTNPRRRRGLDIDSLSALASSLRSHGLMQPIIVRHLPAHRLEETAGMDPRPAYEVIAGERRWRAAQIAELPTMPMLVRDLTDDAVLELQLVENIEREDLDAMEEAEGFALLRDKLGYTVEQIAERIGKGKGASYVRKTMKLLELTPESRDAMYEGHLGRSTGLLVARYPAERQAAIVAYIKSQAVKTPGGSEPAPFRSIAPVLHSRFNTDLSKAAFDIEDEFLVMEAGACSKCPKRTGQATDLFGDADQSTPSSCTDDVCFASKKAAHVQQIRAKAQAEGLQVIDEDEARQLLPSPYTHYANGYVPLTQVIDVIEVDGQDDRNVTVEDGLRKLGKKAPKPMVLINPHSGVATKVLPEDVFEKLFPEEPPEEPKSAGGGREPYVDTRPPEEIAWRDSLVRRAALIRAFDVIRTGERTVDELKRTALALLGSDEQETPGVEDYLGWLPDLEAASDVSEVHRSRVEAMNADQLGQLIAMVSLEIVLTRYPHNVVANDVLKGYGIDILAVRDKVAEDVARQAEQPDDESAAQEAEPQEDSQ